jgi:hypothetical protein
MTQLRHVVIQPSFFNTGSLLHRRAAAARDVTTRSADYNRSCSARGKWTARFTAEGYADPDRHGAVGTSAYCRIAEA